MFIVCDVVVIYQEAERPTINHLQSTEDFLSAVERSEGPEDSRTPVQQNFMTLVESVV